MEPRRLLSASPLHLGAVYIEEDLGSDLHGDRFEITFAGGAPASELTRLVINGDQNTPGFSVGDVFFDTAPGGFGADHALPFTIEELSAAHPDAAVAASVRDGDSLLVLDFTHFRAGDRLVFTIDVDEVEFFDPQQSNLELINDGFDPITSGVEFQGTQLQAEFSAPDYLVAAGSSLFWNRYDPALQESGLPLPADDADGQRDRTTGAFIALTQRPNLVEISGYVFADQSNDGKFDQSTETGIGGVPLRIEPVDTVEPQAVVNVVTDAYGAYRATGLMPGTYRILEETQPSGYLDGLDSAGTVAGVPHGHAVNPGDRIEDIQLPGGAAGINYVFGEIQPTSLSGGVYLTSADGSCTRPPAEQVLPLPDTTVTLWNAAGHVVSQTTTDAAGHYQFTSLVPGTYQLVETTPAGLIDAAAHAGLVDGGQRGQVVDPNTIATIKMRPGDDGRGYDFCEHQPAQLAGYVYHDENDDGQRQEDEAPIAGVALTLRDARGAIVATRVTDAAGRYEFTGLGRDVYQITEQQPIGWTDGQESIGTVDATRTGRNDQNDRFDAVMLRWGSVGKDYDFGELLAASISGHVHVELNYDCIFDADEPALSDVRVELLDAHNNVIADTVTDARGAYQFTDVLPGQYGIREHQPTEYFQGTQHAGSNGGDDSAPDLITQIHINSGDVLVDYDFCELLPSAISGFVFQDGPTIVTPDGRLPADLQAIRDGQFTQDDTPIAGVLLELRNGTTGEAIDGRNALPGRYPNGPIRTITDARGHYEFTGIPRGSYAVYEVHPTAYQDGIDTPGTSSGLAVNRGAKIDPTIWMNLVVDPLNDAIIRIPLAPGQVSEYNNFSEVLVDSSFAPLPPLPPLPSIPPSPDVTAAPLFAWSQGPQGLVPATATIPVFGSAAGLRMTWHLSVVDGGSPRGADSIRYVSADQLQPVGFLSSVQWDAVALDSGHWRFAVMAGAGLDPPIDGGRLGMPGAIPVCGDFNGDGITEVALYYEGQWFVDLNGNGHWDKADMWARLGSPEDLPIVGDWDGDGKDDIGIFGPEWHGDQRALKAEAGLPDSDNQVDTKPKNLPPEAGEATDGQRILKHTADGPARVDVIDHVFRLGVSDDMPVAGDWNGDGVTNIGVFRSGTWFLDTDGDGHFTQRDRIIYYGSEGDIPVVGDFNGDGIDEVGVYRNGLWRIDSDQNHTMDPNDAQFSLGSSADRPVVGDWNGDGTDDPGVYREAG